MAKKAAPAKKPEKAVKVSTVIDTKNRLSSKINYEALDKVNEELLRLSSTILSVLTSSKVYCVRELNPPGFAIWCGNCFFGAKSGTCTCVLTEQIPL
ncbi:uncharacterized protein Pyn_37843 [Prunus yedoensis var. nudiflora]|uniref:Uncharacterized protein n=1 Tax=Prunus yedoensis var. nudiflora TaxID=2094558 RepID=A0A314UZJ0_PRUYE|nr:uncharacterized protein Pyn_37843 [Prunus yedoensis var. nudiflora]